MSWPKNWKEAEKYVAEQWQSWLDTTGRVNMPPGSGNKWGAKGDVIVELTDGNRIVNSVKFTTRKSFSVKKEDIKEVDDIAKFQGTGEWALITVFDSGQAVATIPMDDYIAVRSGWSRDRP